MQRCSFRLLAAVSSPYAVSCNLHAAQTGLDVGRRKRSVGRQLFNHRLCCTAAGKLRLAYLGTPEVSAEVLSTLLEAAGSPQASFEIKAVISQPGRPKGRGRQRVPQPSPVEATAAAAGIGSILCPASAKDPDFLEALQKLRLDLCVTAAYGNILPQAFLDIPRWGTLNIHPSLLPQYRGAAPVQRALQDGIKETGVSVAFTVKAMDAGPVLVQEASAVDDVIQAPELLSELFQRGAQLLLQSLHLVASGKAAEAAQPQDAGKATSAAKLSKEEARLDFAHSALTNHNKVRAFAGWPKAHHTFLLRTPGKADLELPLQVLRTAVCQGFEEDTGAAPNMVHVRDGRVVVGCSGGNFLELLQVQPQSKAGMPARNFANGLQGKQLLWQA